MLELKKTLIHMQLERLLLVIPMQQKLQVKSPFTYSWIWTVQCVDWRWFNQILYGWGLKDFHLFLKPSSTAAVEDF